MGPPSKFHDDPGNLAVNVVVINEGLSPSSQSALHSLVTKAAPAARLMVVPGFVASNVDAPISGHITRAAYRRLLMPQLCPDVNMVLYLDSDTLTRASVWDLLATELDDSPIAAVVDEGASTHAERRRYGELRSGSPPDQPYVNSGILLMNLRAWRDRDLASAVFRYIEREGDLLRFHDQDAINVVLGSEIKLLGWCWNYQLRVERSRRVGMLPEGAAIVHFSDPVKPWATLDWLRQGTIARQASTAWWRVALFSPCLPVEFRIRMAGRLSANAARFVAERLRNRTPQALRHLSRGQKA